MGRVLLSERTDELSSFYIENKVAVFFSSVEEMMEKQGVPSWVEAQRGRKTQLIRTINESGDGRWSKLLLAWEPTAGFRRVGRPVTRWTDRGLT